MAEDQDYDELTNDELHDLLAERELPVSGTKDERIERLEADDRGETTQAPAKDDDLVMTGNGTFERLGEDGQPIRP